MGRIEWIPIEDMEDRFKDGRDLLFWSDDEAIIAFWDRWLDPDSDEFYHDWATREGVHLIGATHFSEVNGPG